MFLVSLVFSTIDPVSIFGSIVDRTMAVSAGSQHLTIVSFSNFWNSPQLIVYNTTTNISSIITDNTGMEITKIQQIRGVNTLATNFWLIQYPMTEVNVSITVVSSQSHTVQTPSWERNISVRTYNVFGANTSIIYQLDSTVGCSLNKKIGSSNTSINISSTPNYTCYNLFYSSGIIYALMYQPSTRTASLKFYNSMTNYALMGTYTFVTTVLYSDIFLTGSVNYYALAYGTKIQIYYSSNRTNVCNITLPSNIFDMKISNSWIYASTTSLIRQYKIQTCMQFHEQTTAVGYYLQYIQAKGNSSERLFTWTNTSGVIKTYNVLNKYTCTSGCTSCISEYGLNNVTKECYYTGIVTVTNTTINTTNTSINTNTTLNTSAINITNNTINTNTSNNTNTSHNNTNTTLNTNSTLNTNTTLNTNSNTIINYGIGISNNSNFSNSQFGFIPQYIDIDKDFIILFNQFIKWLLQSLQFNTTSQVIATATAISSSNFPLRRLFKPFLYLFDQFWLYGYHSVLYPQLFRMFTSQNDLLNDLRIKPKFLNFNFKLLYKKNKKYTNTAQIQSPPLSTIFMLQSLKDVYIYNFFLSFSQFVLIFAFRCLTKKIKGGSYRLKIIYKYLHSNSIWWNLLVSTFQSNIVIITFYVCIQMLCSYSFNFFDKFNLLLTTSLFFFVFCYSYIIYWLLFRYEKQQRSSQMLNVSLFGHRGFLLEMSLNCLRRFNSAFIHGALINHHFLQLLFLMISDFVILCIVIKMRKQFRSKFLVFLNFLYFLSFFCLDCILFVGTYFIFTNNIQDFHINSLWNFVIALFVIVIMAICFVKFIRQCVELALKIFQFCIAKKKLPQKQCSKIDFNHQTLNENSKTNTSKTIKVKDLTRHLKIRTNNKIHDETLATQKATQKSKKEIFASKQSKTRVKITAKITKLKMKTKN